jgi:serine/threonine-protein kinase
MYHKISAFLLYILITVLVLSLYVDKHATLERYEQKMVDVMSKYQGTKAPGSEVAIIAIDDRSFNQVDSWPWDYSALNNLLYHLASANPKAIVFNLPLPRIKEGDTAAAIFADNLTAAGNVILPLEFTLTSIQAPGDIVPPQILKSSYFTYDSFSKLRARPPLWASQMKYPPDLFIKGAADFGFVISDFDPDSKLRKEPLVIGYSDNYYPSIAVQAVKHYLGINAESIKLNPGSEISLAKVKVPMDDKSKYLINYYGPKETFKYMSAADIISGKFQRTAVSNKIALIGLTATRTTQSVTTPLEEYLPEVEKTATVVQNIISGRFLKTERGNLLGFIWIVTIGVFSAFILPRVSLLYRFIVLLAFLFVLVNVNFFLFRSFGIISKTFYPVLELMLFLLVSPAIKPQKDLTSRKKSRLMQKLGELTSFKIVRVGKGEQPIRGYQPRPHAADTVSQTMPVDLSAETVDPVESQTSGVEEEIPVESPKKPTTSTDIPIPMDIDIKEFGRYKVLEPIGRGAMGTVYKGLDPAIDRLVALKTIRLDFAASPEEVQEMKTRLLREARAAGKLSHPNIVTIYDAGQEEGYQYVAMEFLEGTTLEKYIRKKNETNFKIIAQILIQVCDALDYAHSHGIVHRDIKPANIMVLDNFQVKVMDFGIARFGQANITQSGIAMGTPNYMPPEVLKGRSADKRSDIFSLGIMTYELLTGRRPFRGPTISALIYSILNDNPAPPSQVNNRAPAIFDRICDKCLRKDPDQRYQSTVEISTELKQFVAAFVGVKSASKVTS